MEKHLCSIEDVRMAKSFVNDNRNKYEICSLFVMHSKLLSAEDKNKLDSNGVRHC